MFLLIAFALAMVCAILKPLGDGLLDTSLWVAKILTPPDIEDDDTAQQFQKLGQAALLEGSSAPAITLILFFSSVVSGFIYSWWGGILVFFVSITLGMLAKARWGRSVSYYLLLLYQKMANRAANYRMRNDIDRLEASQSYCEDLLKLIALYEGSRLRPPTPKQLKHNPGGDPRYWLEHAADTG